MYIQTFFIKNFGFTEFFKIWLIVYSYEKKNINKIKNGGHRRFFRIKLA